MIKRSKKGRPSRKRTKPVIGWKEWVSFPDLGVVGIRSKVDTGARTSALHATNVREYEVDGTPWVRFTVHCELGATDEEVTIELPLLERRPVRDSGGREEVRPVVNARVELGGRQWDIEVTLTRRDDMEFNMLLGRRAVRGKFLIDPRRVYMLGVPDAPEPKRKKSTKKKKKSTKRKSTKGSKKKTTKKTVRRKPARRKAPAKKSRTRKTSKKKTSPKKGSRP
ncbi:MAG: ATP-dependent zinc protease family protein [Longimicrobiales bacterium]